MRRRRWRRRAWLLNWIMPHLGNFLHDLNNTYCAILIQLLFSSTCPVGILILNVVNILAPAPTLSTNTGNGTHTRSSTRANPNAR